MSKLTHNSYGKSAVRLTKVVRNGPVNEVFEIDAAIQLQGDFEPAYAAGDNSNVVATDSIKNTVYVLGKEQTFASIEDFALLLARHFIATYPQVSAATVELTQSAWRRIEVDGKPHDHAFTSAGPQKRYAKATLDRGRASPALVGGIRGLLVLKTTASEWQNFVADRYRTLKDAPDRLLATSIDADWNYNTLSANFASAAGSIDAAILSTFATQYSLGVQQTLMAMGDAALAACPAIASISFELPNIHHIPFNLAPFELTFANDIFVGTSDPYGLIKGTISRTK